MKRVCFVTHCLQAGGMERVMLEVVAYFAAREEMEIQYPFFFYRPNIVFFKKNTERAEAGFGPELWRILELLCFAGNAWNRFAGVCVGQKPTRQAVGQDATPTQKMALSHSSRRDCTNRDCCLHLSQYIQT